MSSIMFKPNSILQGDVLEKIKEIPDESIDCIITSPPYWGLRDYSRCDCSKPRERHDLPDPPASWTDRDEMPTSKHYPDPNCVKCKGTGHDLQIRESQWGLEPTFHEWIAKMLKLTLELKRVLKKSGSYWLDLGDTYAGGGVHHRGEYAGKHNYLVEQGTYATREPQARLKNYQSKCLCMIPERLALGMIDQGWILRNKIIWHKPNAMPASVRDRLKNSYEVVYHFVKNKKYYYDLDAIRVPAKESTYGRLEQDLEAQWVGSKIHDYPNPSMNPKKIAIRLKEKYKKQDNVPGKNTNQYKAFNKRWKELADKKYGGDKQHHIGGRTQAYMNTVIGEIGVNHNIAGANPGDVWTIATQPFPEAHFATFPEKLVEPMIKATCPKQICSKCGYVRERVTKLHKEVYAHVKSKGKDAYEPHQGTQFYYGDRWDTRYETIGWSTCSCNAEWKLGIVLDPFIGSGTVAVVAQRFGVNWVGIELKEEYIKMAYDRIYKKSVPLSDWQ